ncbi:MAG: Smr/MutS family protein [Alphaproteobacteria bacterium]|uniref:Smr/MutS family protein n=1 Tax=Phenylobacterium sp. TaxID=1871053 RepID=UPI0025E4B321|nr:Smr/MutS family protein [Phenylobacterium sp.]MCA3731724.1 Smr/MutS family protein [Phenylobacterium sp.]MCA3739741.1 Smr/MutS family protein [Phenylobacterium sp.]MCA6321705.1 Smr/MutS family protein [Phenylobacterium sp.]
MRRPLRPEESRLWSQVTSTVHPLPGRASAPADPPPPPREALPAPDPAGAPLRLAVSAAVRKAGPASGPKALEPARRRRISRERDPIGAHIDLHGLGQDAARAALERFVLECWREGQRAVLVITGKGIRGDGVLRRLTPEWLAAPHLQAVVAGISEAHRRHGGEGALYIALKRRPLDASAPPRP